MRLEFASSSGAAGTACAIVVIAAMTLATAPAAAPVEAPVGATSRVVELFTSQGCPKCPAADRLIADFARQPNTIALSYPVDLWDFEGWKDTLASSAFTQRQRDYASARGDRRIFTPQAIVDGIGVEPGADRDAILRDVALIAHYGAALSVPLTLSEAGGKLHVAVGDRIERGEMPAIVYVLRVARAETVEIGRGQNSGRSVTYTNVVRAITKIGEWTGESIHIDMPELKAEGEGYVVLLQAGSLGRPGVILAAAKTPDL